MRCNEPIREVRVDTPTLAGRRAALEQRRTRYRFVLDSEALTAAAVLGDAAVLAYAAIRGAAFGSRHSGWVTISRVTRDLLCRDYKWWYRTTQTLVDAGLVQVSRQRGQLPRYRITNVDCGRNPRANVPEGITPKSEDPDR